MGDFGVIADVSSVVVSALTRSLSDLGQGRMEPPRAELHDLSEAVQTSPPKLTVFLYEIAEDPASRNRPPVRSQPPDPPTTRRPPMALLLRYLITPWGGDQETQHRMLGRALQTFYDDAILDGAQLSGSLAGGVDSLHVTLTPLTLDQKSWVWYAIQKPYRLSLNYEIRVVDLDSAVETPVRPVRSRIIEGTATP
ncbi:DUF4255 domain-containing protein [Streptomyces beigongshangae]|uniref:DUF4255 domain-containing protein n=1 Tax=Streptomyces beigongshangae TaxID=2841597 RepID=UPI001C844845|nr:DUF4255 domain-containing protein [Streptomyces sp. REN17]